jgi:hypothetical protein
MYEGAYKATALLEADVGPYEDVNPLMALKAFSDPDEALSQGTISWQPAASLQVAIKRHNLSPPETPIAETEKILRLSISLKVAKDLMSLSEGACEASPILLKPDPK